MMKELVTSAIMATGSKSKIFHIRLDEIPYAKVRTGLKYDTRNLTASYQRPGSLPVIFPLVEMEIGKYVSGGFIETDRKNLPGYYQICIPDEALALAGIIEIYIGGAKNMIPLKIQVELVDAAPRLVPNPEMPTKIFVDKDYPSTKDNKFSLKEKERQKYVRADLQHGGWCAGCGIGLPRIEPVSEDDFNEWMTDRWNEYSKAGIDQDSRGIEEFIKDFKEKFPEGVKIL